MIPIVLHTASSATALAIRSPNGVVPGLRGNDLLLEARQQQFPFGQGQPQIGYVNEVVGSVDRHDINRLLLTTSLSFHQPQNPNHASTTERDNGRENIPAAPPPPISRQSRPTSIG